MKTQEEIDEVYKKLYLSLDDSPHYHTWVRGYTQCQEDMADKKYTEKDMLKCWNYLMVKMTFKSPVFFKDYINSLNKQD